MRTAASSPLISIIAVSYNHERWILETLESIANQTCSDFELIYADDASQDRTAQIAREWIARQSFPVKTVIHKHNRGLCRTLNEALAQCNGRYLQAIACDDILYPEKLQRQAAMLEESPPEVVLVYSGADLIDADGVPSAEAHPDIYRALNTPLPERAFEYLVNGGLLSTPSTLVKLDAIRAAGGYDEELLHEDWDMWLRLARTQSFLFSSYVSVAYRYLPTGLHNNARLIDHYRMLRKHVDIAIARSALMWTVFKMYEAGQLTADVRKEFLGFLRVFPDMANWRNGMIRLRMPPWITKSVANAMRTVSRSTLSGHVQTMALSVFSNN